MERKAHRHVLAPHPNMQTRDVRRETSNAVCMAVYCNKRENSRLFHVLQSYIQAQPIETINGLWINPTQLICFSSRWLKWGRRNALMMLMVIRADPDALLMTWPSRLSRSSFTIELKRRLSILEAAAFWLESGYIVYSGYLYVSRSPAGWILDCISPLNAFSQKLSKSRLLSSSLAGLSPPFTCAVLDALLSVACNRMSSLRRLTSPSLLGWRTFSQPQPEMSINWPNNIWPIWRVISIEENLT